MSDARLFEKQITESEVRDEDKSETDTLTAEEVETKTGVVTTEDDCGMETDDLNISEKYETADDSSGSHRTFAATISVSPEGELRREVVAYFLPQDMSIDGRHIKEQDLNWAKSQIRLLSDIKVKAADNIEASELENFLNHANEYQKENIFCNLPLTLSLKSTLPLIEEGIYWKRMCLTFWPAYDIRQYSDNWKSMLVHRKVQDLIANFVPGQQDIWELVESLQVCSEYVTTLKIEKLVKAEHQEISIDLSSEDFREKLDGLTATATEPSAHVLDFERIFECFPKLKKLEICLSDKYFDFKNPHFSIPDFNSLLRGLCKLKELRNFGITNGNATNEQIIVILKTFLTHSFLTELDFAYNSVDNDVCYHVRKLLISRCPLECLILRNNNIRDAGAKSIAAGMLGNRKLKKLDLSTNEIGSEGARLLARVLQSNSMLEELNVSDNHIMPDAGLDFANLIRTSNKLEYLIIYENYLGESTGKLFAKAVTQNSTLLQLDVTSCGFRHQDEEKINKFITKNRSKTDKPFFFHWS